MSVSNGSFTRTFYPLLDSLFDDHVKCPCTRIKNRKKIKQKEKRNIINVKCIKANYFKLFNFK